MALVTVTRAISHLCPYVDEVDIGTISVSWDNDAHRIELHGMGVFLDKWAKERISHEDMTDRIAEHFAPCIVVTTWNTAGFVVTVKAGGDGSLLRESDRLQAGA
jgi:NADPH-dependent 7-cyano-7-deazaguanine reductase QueF